MTRFQSQSKDLTLNAPIATSRLLFSSAEMYKKPLWQIGAVCSGFKLFGSILNTSVMLRNYLQQTTSADNIFRCIFFLGALRVNDKTVNS